VVFRSFAIGNDLQRPSGTKQESKNSHRTTDTSRRKGKSLSQSSKYNRLTESRQMRFYSSVLLGIIAVTSTLVLPTNGNAPTTQISGSQNFFKRDSQKVDPLKGPYTKATTKCASHGTTMLCCWRFQAGQEWHEPNCYTRNTPILRAHEYIEHFPFMYKRSDYLGSPIIPGILNRNLRTLA
jgi:hypothetical protein